MLLTRGPFFPVGKSANTNFFIVWSPCPIEELGRERPQLDPGFDGQTE